MKRFFVLLGLFFVITSLFAQEIGEQENKIITEIIQEKPSDYFKLKKILKKKGFSRSITSLETLNTKSKESNYNLGQIYALHYIGLNLKKSSKYKRAITVVNQALEISERTGNINAKIVLLNTIGAIYRGQNDIENALMYHQNAVAEIQQIKNPSKENIKSIAIAKNSIGNLYLKLDQYSLALQNFKESLEIQLDIRDTKGLAINYQNVGKVNEELGFLDKALENYYKSLEYNIQNKSSIGKIICYNSICSALIKNKEYDDALEIAKENYKNAGQLKNKYYYTQTVGKLGLAYLKTNQLEKAKPLLEDAYNTAKEYNYNDYMVESSLRMSELYSELKDDSKALSYYKEAINKERETKGKLQTLFVGELVNKLKAQPKLDNIINSQNKLKIRDFEANRSRNVLIITLISLALLSVALYSIYRQRLLNNDRQVLLLEQQALQAQMNPHFIFNALNSIKLYIINNEQKNAVYYLNKFSKLIRNILDVSKVKDVSLKEELDTMDLYMSIENIRFNNEIRYEKQINDSLNLDTIKVPPLLLQPFLENAIWHGLSSKNGKKEVILSAFKVSKNLVEINITDNGVGRKAAMEIKKNKSLKRKSVGLDLTTERLKTFSGDFNHDFSLKYYDLRDDDGKPIGTKVALRIPLS